MIELAAAAAAGAGRDLVQALPSVATIAGALITGFGAAGLKHRWDVAADDTRWRRERAARVRAQRLDAFARYLSSRPDLQAVRSLAEQSRDPADVVSAARLAAANLLILLPDAQQRAVVEADLSAVEHWVAARITAPSRGDRKDVPSTQPILDLARGLAVEPETETDR